MGRRNQRNYNYFFLSVSCMISSLIFVAINYCAIQIPLARTGREIHIPVLDMNSYNEHRGGIQGTVEHT